VLRSFSVVVAEHAIAFSRIKLQYAPDWPIIRDHFANSGPRKDEPT